LSHVIWMFVILLNNTIPQFYTVASRCVEYLKLVYFPLVTFMHHLLHAFVPQNYMFWFYKTIIRFIVCVVHKSLNFVCKYTWLLFIKIVVYFVKICFGSCYRYICCIFAHKVQWLVYKTHKEPDDSLIRPKNVVVWDRCMKQVIWKVTSGKYTCFKL
jgi:hypothetical protein